MRLKISILLLGALIVLFSLLIFFKFEFFCNESYQKEFVVDAGFLSNKNNTPNAIINYAEAIEIIRLKELNDMIQNNSIENEGAASIRETDLDKICDLVINGAKMQELEVSSVENWSMAVRVQNHGVFKFSEIILLPKIINQIAKVDLKQKRKLERVLLLGKASIAMGIQFSTDDSNLMKEIGFVCKRGGLDILKAYVEVCANQELTVSINRINIELEGELEKLKKQKDWEPTFWDFFNQCRKSEIEVKNKIALLSICKYDAFDRMVCWKRFL